MASQTIRVRTPSGSYDVVCGHGALRRLAALVQRVGDSTGFFLLSSPKVWRHWGRVTRRALEKLPVSRVLLFDDREPCKRLRTVETICQALHRAGADRQATFVALGGGVVGDVAGFVAASYLRGVKLVHVPSTLVAQVDSAIGGKTGVNLPEGKNLVGAFYQPRLVIVDPALLSTLPERQYRSGLYEVLKYGVIGGAALFRFFELHLNDLLRRRAGSLEWVLPRCIRAKAEIVRRDERESGLRQVLNFGHTLGHALEAETRYRQFLHGEAIAWGMTAATLLSLATRRLTEADAGRIVHLIARVGPLPSLRGISSASLLRTIPGDKKARGGKVGWVLLNGIGSAQLGLEVAPDFVRRAFQELPQIFQAARGGH